MCIPKATAPAVSAHITGKIHFNIYLHEYFSFFSSFFFLCEVKNNVEITKRVWGMRAWLQCGGGKLGGDHQKGKLCTAGRKIIVLPQVKNIVALLKSACKASYIIRMFKY